MPMHRVWILSLILSQATLTASLQSYKTATTSVKENTFSVIWDSGASISISPHRSDFVGPLEPPSVGIRLQGIVKGLAVHGIGHVAWSFVDNRGQLRTLKLPAYFVPKATARLLSTNSLLKTYPSESITLLHDRLILSGTETTEVSGIEILVDPRSNLHVGTAYDGSKSTRDSILAAAYATTTSPSNVNLSTAEKELLQWHCRLGHLSFKKIQFLMQSGVLAHSESARRLQTSAAKLTSCPMCAACQFGKQRRHPTPGKVTKAIREKRDTLRQDDLFPGQKVSVDHFACSTRGRLPHTFGKEDPKQQYSGGAMFVDHASGFIFVKHQVTLDTHSTIAAKEDFEATCRDFGVVVAEYLSDNGTAFTAAAYRQHLSTFAQTTRYAGFGAHHHNGIAERTIQTVMSIARTMMLHSAIHWPAVANASLWPLAVNHAVRLYNSMPNPQTGLSPQDVFTKIRWRQSGFQNFHVWGCPVYVLDHTIADGKKLPRWKPRSSRHLYVGMSNKHSSSVPLCLNLETGAITPQFHVVFDENFATIATTVEDLPDFSSPQWNSLFGSSVYQYVLDDDDLVNAGNEPADLVPPPRLQQVADAMDHHLPPQPLPTPPPALVSPLPSSSVLPPSVTDPLPPPRGLLPSPSLPPSRTLQDPSTPVASLERENNGALELDTPLQRENKGALEYQPPLRVEQSEQREHSEQQTSPPNLTHSPKPTTAPASASRPTRNRKAPNRYGYDGNQSLGYTAMHSSNENVPEPSIYKARAMKDPDTLTFDEAMRSPQREQWMKSAQKEITGLENRGTWTEVPMSEALTKILPGAWVFRKKRSPSGEIRKFKARYCVRGDLKEDDDEDNYAPVVAWSTVRLFLVLCFLLEWTTASIDFTNAFVQSILDTPIWIHIPRGFVSTKGPGSCLKLRRSLYGLKRSPRLFFETLLTALIKLGFTQSKFDPCLLYQKDIMIVIYVDDCGIGASNPTYIDKLVEDLQKLGFELTREESFSEFLGIKLKKRHDGSIELTQKGLIDKIITATKMEDCNPNYIPATVTLGSDPDGHAMSEEWNYSSIIGMLLYLSTNTRPDIAFAVSQAARFSSNPKQSHATAIKTIVRYLKRTSNQGTILKPTRQLDLDLFVDADFCSLFRNEDDKNPDSARSRTGYIVTLSGFPLIWKSHLQSSITCSTLEAEYSALSSSLKALLPLKRTLIEATIHLQINHNFNQHSIQRVGAITSTIRARVFEDNQGAFLLATNHRITNRTRYFLNKFHWFWQHAGEFELFQNCNQKADYLTKALTREPFENNRRIAQGW